MTQKRCAYFGCMHPMFEPTHHSQKYCSDECAAKGHRRLPATKAADKRYQEKLPEQKKKQNALRSARAGYRRLGAGIAPMPDWMKS